MKYNNFICFWVTEKALFMRLKDYRIANNREFFDCDVAIITKTMNEIEKEFNECTDLALLDSKYKKTKVYKPKKSMYNLI